jgi:hypothetical protein
MRTGCPDAVVVKYAIHYPPFKIKISFLVIGISKNHQKYKLLPLIV